MKKRSLAHTYARVLSGLCSDEERMNAYLSGLDTVNGSLAANPLLNEALVARNLMPDEKERILNALFQGKIDDQLLFFLNKLADKNLTDLLPDILSHFKQLVSSKLGHITVRAITPVPLTDANRKALYSKLSASSPMKIDLVEEVNTHMLGGIKLLYSNNKMIDFSIRAKLERLKNLLQQKGQQHAIES
jgi:F-type H+-transporting ATPase subunit delta